MAAFKGDSIFWVEVSKIVPNPYQPRKEFDESKLKDLSESIRMYGVLQPLTVSRTEVTGENGAFRTEYELIAGERRLRASKLAGLEQVPVLIREGEESEQEKLELAIIENLQREDLNAVDRALAFRQLADVFGLSHSQVAMKVGRSREYVSNSIRLLGLPDYMLQSLKEQDITEGHARTLLMLNDRPEEQDTVYREILLKKLSVREVERITRKIATDKVRSKKWQDSDPVLIEKEKEFTESLGTRVQIAKTDYGGKITIDYFSDEDLEKLLQIMTADGQQMIHTATSVAAATAVAEEMEEVIEETDDALGSVFAHTPLEAVPENDTHVDEPVNIPDTQPEPAEVSNEGVDQLDSESNTRSVANVPETEEDKPEPMSTTSLEALDSEREAEAPEPVKTISPLRAKLASLFGEPKPASSKTNSEHIQSDITPENESNANHDDETEANSSVSVVEPESEQKTTTPKEVKNDSEDDLYNLKNFSI